MRKIALFLGIWILLAGCHQNMEKPKEFLNENQMTEILSDLYIHQQSSYIVEADLKNPDMAIMDLQILQKHNISPEVFKENYRYYFLHTEMFNSLMENVINNLENMLPDEERLKNKRERDDEEEPGPADIFN